MFLLTACNLQSLPSNSRALPDTASPTPFPLTATFRPAATFTVTPYPTKTPVPVDPAKDTVQKYYDALESKDAEGAARLISSYSLMVHEMTRSDAASQLQGRFVHGDTWTDLAINEQKAFDENTILIRLTYQFKNLETETGAVVETQVDEWWPIRNENGQWLYNWENLIDFRTLEISEQTTAGMTIKPRQMTRYSDHICLTLLAQNQTNEPIVLGQVNETLATFVFGDKKVEAEQTQFIFDRLRSYPSTDLIVKGLFPEYPDSVIIREWKNLQVEPWYTFDLN